jgi:hypothetical protein
MTNNCWCSVDTHFHDGAESVPLSLLPIDVANTWFMTVCNLLPGWLSKIHDQESFTVCWWSIDIHFHHGAGSVSHSLLPLEASNASFMTICNLLPTWLPKIHDQESLTVCWRSVDAHFHHGAGSVSLPLLLIEAANTSFRALRNLSPARVSKIHDQESLTLCWRSFS